MTTAASPRPSAEGLKIVEDATCPLCGCVCDDINLSVEGDRIIAAAQACPIGQSWFLNSRGNERPNCLIAGQRATVEQGIERAAEILTSARYPLIYGLSHTTCEAQSVAVGIADWIGGTVDTATSIEHGPTGVAFQGVGEVTCSLGEVANRGDLIMLWGSNPAESHPRHFSKYSLLPRGMFVPGGRADRTCVVIDVHQTASAAEADVFVPIKPGHDFEALWVLRALARDLPLDEVEIARQTGVPLATWRDLMERMKRAKFGVILFGPGLTMTRGAHLNTEALLALVRDMNAHTRFVAKRMHGRGNVTGADSVLTWRTGYPFGVNLSRGYPRFNPGEFTAVDMLARGEVDAAMIVTGDPLSDFPQVAREHLSRIPFITLDSGEMPTTRAAAVAFTTATYGIHVGGTVYRMDDVPLPLRPALRSPHPSDFEVLSAIDERIKKLTRERLGGLRNG